MDELLVEGIVKALSGEDLTNITFECLNCGTKFSGVKIEEFVRHQLKKGHFEYEKHTIAY